MKPLILSFILSVALTGCAHGPTTRCGLEIYGDYIEHTPGFFTQEVVQQAEDRFLEFMQGTADSRLFTPEAACKALNGFSVRSHPEHTFMSFGQRVSGITDCPGDKIVVATPMDGKWYHTALAHELVHVVQRCRPRLPSEDGRDNDHANWSMDNIDSALESINQESNP